MASLRDARTLRLTLILCKGGGGGYRRRSSSCATSFCTDILALHLYQGRSPPTWLCATARTCLRYGSAVAKTAESTFGVGGACVRARMREGGGASNVFVCMATTLPWGEPPLAISHTATTYV